MPASRIQGSISLVFSSQGLTYLQVFLFGDPSMAPALTLSLEDPYIQLMFWEWPQLPPAPGAALGDPRRSAEGHDSGGPGL